MRTFLAVALVAGLLAGGCGAGGSNAAERQIAGEDQRWAEAASLALADFPDGWVVSEPETDEAPPDECASVDLSDLTITGEAEHAFDDEEAGRYVLAARAVLESLEDARESVERGTGDELEECIRDGFVAEAEREESAEFQIEDVEVSEVAAPAVGQLSRAFRIAFAYVFGEAERVPATLDVLTIQRDRATVTLGLLAVGDPFPPGLAERLARAADRRVEREPPP